MKIADFIFKNFVKPAAIIIAILAGFNEAAAQELNVEVTLDRSQISSTSLNYMDSFPAEVESYFNEHDWIDAGFREYERIDAGLQIVLLSVDDNYNFQANLVIRSQRPIYNTTRQTTLLLLNDESWAFQYTPNRAMTHDELQFDALTTLLDFYAYVMLGFDFDSFSELGGTPYFSEAQNLLSLGQTTSSPGWSSSSGSRRGRAQLISDLQNPIFQDYRRAIYVYHRHGLDRFISDPEEARKEVLRALELMREVQRSAINDFLFDIFFNAKYREIASIFEDASTEVRLEAYNLLSNMDQSHMSEYDKLQ